MSGGPRQLFDPEAPPEATAPVSRAADGGAEPEDRRGVHSIGGVYEQVEGALTRPFPGTAISGSGGRSRASRITARAISI